MWHRLQAGYDWPEERAAQLYGREGRGGPGPNAIIRDGAGNLYGTTVQGGDISCGCGTVFMLDTTGKTSALHNFGGTDGGPYTGVIRDKLGNLYGTTYFGGDFDQGVVFKITP